jgi:hypothetical protein
LRAEKIVIADLREPVLSTPQRAALAAAEAYPVDISEQAVLEQARIQTGLSDFGMEDFRKRLRLWADSINALPDLTALGRAGLFADMVRYAANRLRIEDLVERHPEILKITIDRPIVVAGLPRSGTTFLQNILSSDERLRSLPYWEAVRPVPEPGAESSANRMEDPRRAQALATWAQHDALMPFVKAIHEMSADHTSEDGELQALDFGGYVLEWYASPATLWAEHYWKTDQTDVYRYLKKVLQALTWLHGPNRWLLKNPQHMEQLPVLHRVFPDATIVITHRDPVASVQSAVTALAYAYRITRTRIDTGGLIAYWLPRFEKLLRRCAHDHGSIPTERIVDVYFHELMAEPMRVLGQIYDAAGLPLTADIRSRLSAFLRENRRGKHGQVVYDLRGDFGVDPAEARRNFDFYFARFPVKVEVI